MAQRILLWKLILARVLYCTWGARIVVDVVSCFHYTAISTTVVGKIVHATIPKGNMGYDQYTVPDTVAVEPTFVAFL